MLLISCTYNHNIVKIYIVKGVVKEISVSVDERVKEDQVLVIIESDEELSDSEEKSKIKCWYRY